MGLGMLPILHGTLNFSQRECFPLQGNPAWHLSLEYRVCLLLRRLFTEKTLKIISGWTSSDGCQSSGSGQGYAVSGILSWSGAIGEDSTVGAALASVDWERWWGARGWGTTGRF